MTVVPATHARRALEPDPPFELGLSAHLRDAYSPPALQELLSRFATGPGDFDRHMRRAILRALTRRFGQSVEVGRNISVAHPETFEIGDGVFIGDHAILQGRIGGHCVIGDRVWIGPQAFLDARALVIEASVGIGPGVKILGSAHSGDPASIPVIETDLVIGPVHIGTGGDIGIGAIIMPAVTIGQGAIVGAGAVVTSDVPPYTIVAGAPARVLRRRADAPV